jgi:hypothetical protein
MKKPRKRSTQTSQADGKYEVGYKRPPVATRFRSGGVGNPRGRPKKQKTVGQMLDEALMTRVKLEENGRQKTVTALEIIFRNLVSAAARGDHAATRTIFGLYQRHKDSAETTIDVRDLDKEDREILAEYFSRLQTSGTEPAVTSSRPEANDSGASGSGHPSLTAHPQSDLNDSKGDTHE